MASVVRANLLDNMPHSSEFPISVQNTAFVLVYDKLCHGGIETMILRISRKLKELGAYTCIMCKEGGDLDEATSPYADIFYQRSLDDISKIAHEVSKKADKHRSIIIISFDTGASTRAIYFEQLISNKTTSKNITGIFHPQAYFMPGQPLDRIFLNKITLSLYGVHNTFFMNEECKFSHGARFGLDYRDAPVIILPVIDDTEYAPAYTSRSAINQTLKILSVGRIVPFKAYNLGAPAILKSLVAAGIDVQWDIYGYGEDEEQVKKIARDLEISDRLHMRGLLTYGSLPSIIDRYDIFVGMGTAALEAASLGLPSICAIINHKNQSYGFVHELPLGNVGEEIPGRPMYTIDQLLARYAKLSINEKLNLIHQSTAYCKYYNTEGFLRSLMIMSESAETVKRSFSRKIMSRFICEITEGQLGKFLFGNGIKTRLKGMFRSCS